MKYYLTMTLVAILLAIRPALAQRAAHPFQVGKIFPHIVLPSFDDSHALSVAQFRGQKVVLHVWASW